MAVRKNFIVKNGLEVADSAVISGTLVASGLSYPTTDGNTNEVIQTDGSGNLSFNALRIRDLSDVDLSTLEEEGLLVFDSATNTFQARNEIVGADINSDGGFY